MASNPMNIRFDDDVFEKLEAEQARTRQPITRLVNARLNHSYNDFLLSEWRNWVALPEVVYLQRMNTTATAHSLQRILRLPHVQRVVFAARSDALNDRCLVMVIELDHLIVVANTDNSIARRPRELEIQELMQNWHAQPELATKTRMIPELVELDKARSPGETLNALYRYDMNSFDLTQFVVLMGRDLNSIHLDDYRLNPLARASGNG